jgi:hypothetical protein
MAGPHVNTDAVIAVHQTAKAKGVVPSCPPGGNNPYSGAYVVLPPAYDVNDENGLGSGTASNNNYNWVWLMIANADEGPGIAGMSCGVQWQQLDGTNPGSMSVAFDRCGELEFPSGGWPNPGGGNRITWAPQSNCQRNQPAGGKVTAVAGWFTVYSYYIVNHAFLRITQNMNVPTPELAIADCNAVETLLHPSHAGWVGWNNGACPGPNCQVPGCNPYLGPCEAPVPTRPTTWGKIKTLVNGE